MSIEANHWARICVAIETHAKELYPINTVQQRELVEKLLCIKTTESLNKKSHGADAAIVRMNKELDSPVTWWKKYLPWLSS